MNILMKYYMDKVILRAYKLFHNRGNESTENMQAAVIIWRKTGVARGIQGTES
jgi:hypothetical protein